MTHAQTPGAGSMNPASVVCATYSCTEAGDVEAVGADVAIIGHPQNFPFFDWRQHSPFTVCDRGSSCHQRTHKEGCKGFFTRVMNTSLLPSGLDD